VTRNDTGDGVPQGIICVKMWRVRGLLGARADGDAGPREERAREVRRLHAASNYTSKQLARMFGGPSAACARQIVLGRT
jgi:hypothetical protein